MTYNVTLQRIFSKIEELENRIRVLENENIGLTNALYELENSLEAKDWAHPESGLFKHYSLGGK
jgi:chaperonin cofactor prefoldin